eukprot:CAMPEP_0201574230 /NCGR_PEP_ID=MMETSP0190_2-20130828/18585_1 /ASSEMBLY_ACC=CAM_ASM_000263 /TAXON_ID=37353 /ORGANISM="Rosalina sp." /LENGTH=603 /DNA_ID=CAMNT_0048002213 /DNA_START=22 /DNA_END=1833 /DNA_ORIENTATION=-
MLAFCLLFLSPISFVNSHRDISWFKDTKYHYDNIINIENSWRECEDWTDVYDPIGSTDDVNSEWEIHFTALCISLKIPLDWDDQTLDETIYYTIARIYNRDDIENTADNGAFWMINGGPGGPGYQMYSWTIPWLTFVDGTYDLYVHDHRGVPYSTEFSCPTEMFYSGDFKACSTYTANYWGNNSYFSTYQAAFDIAYAIDLFSNDFSAYNGDNTVLYGTSYGTYLVNKYLQLYPNQVRAVILDGVCAGDECKLQDQDEAYHDTAIKLFNRCGEDPFCNAQFVPEYGDTIIEAIEYIYGLFDDNDGHLPCNPLKEAPYNMTMSTESFQQAIFISLLEDEHKRMLIMPFLKRIARCNADDYEVLRYALQDEDEYNNEYNNEYQNMLGFNIKLSELWYGDDPRIRPPVLEKDYYLSQGASNFYSLLWDQWVKYLPPMDLYNKYANPQIPILLINGDLDPMTRVEWARDAALNFGANTDDGNHRYYVEFPNVVHNVFIKSPMTNYTDYSIEDDEYNRDYETCAFHVVKSFIDDPYSTPDTQCLEWLIPLDWRMSTKISKEISEDGFGITNAWGEIKEVIIDPTTPDDTEENGHDDYIFINLFDGILF